SWPEVTLALAIAAYSAAAYALGANAVVLAWRRERTAAAPPGSRWTLYAWAICAVYFVALAGPGGDARYRDPSEPFIVALAATTLASWTSTARSSRAAGVSVGPA